MIDKTSVKVGKPQSE